MIRLSEPFEIITPGGRKVEITGVDPADPERCIRGHAVREPDATERLLPPLPNDELCWNKTGSAHGASFDFDLPSDDPRLAKVVALIEQKQRSHRK